MNASEINLLDKVVGSTQSELILFFVIFVVAMVVAMIPLYAMISKDKKHKNELENTRQENYIKRESRIIEVIMANTEVMAGLKTTLEANGLSTASSFSRILERFDLQDRRLNEISNDQTQMKTLLERSIHNQNEIEDDVSKVLLAVAGMSNTGNFQANKEA